MVTKIVTRMKQEDLYEASNEKGNKVMIDMRKEGKVNLSPTETVLAALAGCGAVDIVGMLKKRKKIVNAFTIESHGTRQDTNPHYYTQIHCKYILDSPDVTEDELTKAAALALEKYCSVASSLKAEITFSVEINRN